LVEDVPAPKVAIPRVVTDLPLSCETYFILEILSCLLLLDVVDHREINDVLASLRDLQLNNWLTPEK
jgi:hypothetical protein